MASHYDGSWTPVPSTLNPFLGSVPAVDPSSLPLTEEPVADFKPATKRGFRYEYRNAGGDVISRAVPADVPTGEPAKGKDTLYGRYTTEVPTMVAKAKAIATGGDLVEAREVFNQIDTWIEADRPRLLKHMAYQGRDAMAVDFAEQAGKAVRKDWLQDPEVQMLMNPKTNQAVAKRRLALGGFTPSSKLYEDAAATDRGDTEASARIHAFRDATGSIATPVQPRAGVRGAADGGRPAASTPLPGNTQFLEKVYDQADAVASSLFGDGAAAKLSLRDKYATAAQYTALEDMHPQAPRIITKAMGGVKDADPRDQIAQFNQAASVVREVSDVAGDLAPDALIAFESLMETRGGAPGPAFRSTAPAMQRTAVSVAGQVAAARRLGFDVSDDAIKGFAAISAISASNSSQMPEAYRSRAAAIETFLAPYHAMTTDAPLGSPLNGTAATDGQAASGEGGAEAQATSGFSMIADRIKSLARATALSSAGDPKADVGALQSKLLERHQDVGAALMVFGGDVPGADSKSRPMKRDEADAYGMLLLAYVAENPQVSIVNAYDTIRKEVGIRSAAEVAAETAKNAKAAAKAKTEAEAADAKKASDMWGSAVDAVRLRRTNRENIRQALRQGPTIAPGVSSVDANLYDALATGPSVARKVGLSPGYKPVSLVREEVKKALVPVTQAVTAAAWKAFWDLTPEQALELRRGARQSMRDGRPFLLSDVSSNAYAKLVKARIAIVKKELSAHGAEQSLALIGDDVLNSAAITLARPIIWTVEDLNLARLEKVSGTSGRTVGELFSEAEIKQMQDSKRSFFDLMPDYLSAGVMHTALSKGEVTPEDRAKMVDKLFGPSGFMLGGTQAIIEGAPEVARNLENAGMTLGDYADTYFGRILPAANKEPASASQKPTPAYVTSAQAAYVAAHPGKELDLGRALEAGQAVSDRIKSRPLTEAARDALYGQTIRQHFLHQGLGLDELDYYADSLQTAYYAGDVPLAEIPREYTKLLGGALSNKQKQKADAEQELWEKRVKIKNESRGATEGLGAVTPDVAPSTEAERPQ